MTAIHTVSPGLYSAGQPSPEELAELAQEGLRTIINLRPQSEVCSFDEGTIAQGLGLRYVAIPVAGATDLTKATVSRFSEALAEALKAGPVLVHCASANRVGALMALEQGWIHGADAASALILGRRAGLTSLEPNVTELLQRGNEAQQLLSK